MTSPKLFTVGHSNRTALDLVRLLLAHGIRTVCDVRAFPKSSRWPHFDREALEPVLQDAGIEYVWLGEPLGGYRKGKRTDSVHTALDSFRSYADHMESDEFRAGIARLLALACETPTAYLCAEKDWRRCHRRLISDHLVELEGAAVVHLLAADACEAHALDPRARVVAGRLVYDRGAQAELF